MSSRRQNAEPLLWTPCGDLHNARGGPGRNQPRGLRTENRRWPLPSARSGAACCRGHPDILPIELSGRMFGRVSAQRFLPVAWFQASSALTHSSTGSPLPSLGCIKPSTMNVGDTWMPFWRAYFACHLISASSSGNSKASASARPV